MALTPDRREYKRRWEAARRAKLANDPDALAHERTLRRAGYLRNKTRVLAYQKRYREANKEKIAAAKQRWAARNPEKVREHGRKNNKAPWAAARRLRYVKKRYATDPNFRLAKIVAVRISKALGRIGASRAGGLAAIVGCQISNLRAHLESRFDKGMTWANQGYWHIDHIRPVSSFDLSDPAQVRACFHYTNLQPLWAADNIRKGDKILT